MKGKRKRKREIISWSSDEHKYWTRTISQSWAATYHGVKELQNSLRVGENQREERVLPRSQNSHFADGANVASAICVAELAFISASAGDSRVSDIARHLCKNNRREHKMARARVDARHHSHTHEHNHSFLLDAECLVGGHEFCVFWKFFVSFFARETHERENSCPPEFRRRRNLEFGPVVQSRDSQQSVAVFCFFSHSVYSVSSVSFSACSKPVKLSQKARTVFRGTENLANFTCFRDLEYTFEVNDGKFCNVGHWPVD